MSHLKLADNPTWHTNINQVETNEPITGGSNGNANLATRQLAENAAYLKKQVESLAKSNESTNQTLGGFMNAFAFQLGVEYMDGRKEDSHVKLPLNSNGTTLTFQFGEVKMDRHPGEGAYNLNFERPFENKCLAFFATPKIARQGGVGVDSSVTVFELTPAAAKLNLQLFSNSAVGDWRGFYWLAVGY